MWSVGPTSFPKENDNYGDKSCMASDLQILRDLTEIARTAGGLASGRGRYERTPDFSAPAHRSSRPRSDRGTTFHFSHKTVSKSNDVSEGNYTQTTSSAHQGYIERPSATEKSTEEITAALTSAPDEGSLEEGMSAGYPYPARSVDPERISFGTLGKTKEDRKRFWQEVELSEGKRSRIQSRIIAELPAELGPKDRATLARDFCQQFEDRRLPYWATLHAPTKKNDPRNYHLHITYLDRPAGRSESGQWDFTVAEKKKRTNGSWVIRRPMKKPKHPETREIAWPKRLRRAYADTCNFYLALSGSDKRHDPRSYRESGVGKEPTEHLGNKCSALESFGLETEPGKRNARREIRWRFTMAEKPWVERAQMLNSSEEFAAPDMSATKERLFEIASRGITTARRSASHDITAELLTYRVEKRDAFLADEVVRLTKKDTIETMGDDSQNALALQSESLLIEERKSRIAQLAAKCRANGKRFSRASDELRRQFDKVARSVTLDDLFEEASEDFSSIDDLVGDQARVEQEDPFLSGEEMDDISDLIGDLVPEEERRENRRLAVREQPQSVTEPHQEDSPVRDEKAAPAPMPRRDPIVDIIARLAGSDNDGSEQSGQEDLSVSDFPGAWTVAAPEGREDIKALDSKLAKLDNRSLRLTAIASRDATDICPAGQLREDLNRGWVVLRFEAQRRGLDLDTGVHDPSKGTDRERAELHRDQEPCPIRVIRKDLERQRTRT